MNLVGGRLRLKLRIRLQVWARLALGLATKVRVSLRLGPEVERERAARRENLVPPARRNVQRVAGAHLVSKHDPMAGKDIICM